MIAGNTKGDENPTVACKHGVPSVDLNFFICNSIQFAFCIVED